MKLLGVSLLLGFLARLFAQECTHWKQECQETGNLLHFKEKFMQLNQECKYNYFLQVQFMKASYGYTVKLEMNAAEGMRDILLQICNGECSFLSSLYPDAVSSCKYKNDTYVMMGKNEMYQLEVPLDYPNEKTVIRYVVLHKKCFYEGHLKFQNISQISNRKYTGVLQSVIRRKRQVSNDGDEYLLAGNTDKIYQLSLDGNRKRPLVSNLIRTVALDYDLRRDKLYWTDVSRRVVMQSNLNGSGVITLLQVGLSVPDGMAVDWMTNKIYITDAGLDVISVFDPTQFFYKTLINTGLGTQPRAIVLDPTTRYMYWTDWGIIGRIERASMDGRNRQVLHSTGLVWPNAMTLDYETQTLFWADASLDRVESSRVDGSYRRVLANSGVTHPFGIVEYENILYISDWTGNSIRVMNTSGGFSTFLTSTSTCNRVFGITLVSAARQPMATNPCGVNNGRCSHFCLLSSNSDGYSCSCPDGMTLSGNRLCTGLVNSSLHVVPERVIQGSCTVAGYRTSCCRNATCKGSPPNCYCDANCHLYGDCCSDVPINCLREGRDPYLIVAESKFMRLIDTRNLSRFHTVLSNLNNSFDMDHHYRLNTLFWSDISSFSGIWRSNLDGTEVFPVLLSSTTISGVAVDWMSDNLYWGDYNLNTINVMDINTGHQTTLIRVVGVYRPIQMIVDPTSRYLYWSTQITGQAGGAIYRASMDGSNSHSIAVLSNSVSIALDRSSGIIYWTSGNQLGSVQTSGSNYRVITSLLPLPYKYLTLLSDNVLFMAYGYNATYIYTNGTIKQHSIEYIGCDSFRYSTLISQYRQTEGQSPCSINNGGCSDLCLLSAVHSSNYTCACHNDAALSANQRDCLGTATVEPPPQKGSCRVAGITSCCVNDRDCRGSPPTCSCDVSCVRFRDCCSDVTSTCSNISTPVPVTMATAATMISTSAAVSTDNPSTPTAIVTIMGPPMFSLEFMVKPSDIVIIQNMPAILPCSVLSTVPAAIEWKFAPFTGGRAVTIANQEGSFYPQDYNVVSTVNGLSLVIQSANFSHSHGVFTCRAFSNGKTISASATVNISFPPEVIISGPNNVTELNQFQFLCEVVANPSPSVVWLNRRQGRVTSITDSATRVSISTGYDAVLNGYRSVLTILRAVPDDSGEYICEASNGVLPTITRFATKYLQVLEIDNCLPSGISCHNGGTCIDRVGGFSCVCSSGSYGQACEELVTGFESKPSIQESPVSTNANLNTPLNLTCVGSQAMGYQWYKDNHPIHGETLPFLYFQDFSPEDRGNYSCEVINGNGHARSAAARINIPGIYQYNITLSVPRYLNRTELQDIVLKITTSNATNLPFSVHSVESQQQIRSSRVVLLLTVQGMQSASINVLRQSLISYLLVIPSISLYDVRRFDGCEMEEYKAIMWSETDILNYDTEHCSCSQFLGSLSGQTSRYCAGDYRNGAYWLNEADFSQCVANTSITTGMLCDAAVNVGIAPAEVSKIVSRITSSWQNLTAADIAAAASVVHQLAGRAAFNEQIIHTFLTIIDNIQRAASNEIIHSQAATQSSHKILNSLQYFSESLDIRNFTSANVVFSLHTYALQLQDILTSQFRGEVFTVDLGSVSEAMNIEGNIPRNKIATSELTTNISRNLTTAAEIPRSFVGEVKECQNRPPSTTQRLSHFLFLTDVLFQSEVDNSSILASVILSSRLSCADNRSLSVPVKTFYRINEMIRGTATGTKCVRWDNEMRVWSNVGCKTISSEHNYTSCECTQLGHYGILFDLQTSPPIPAAVLLVSLVTYIGTLISLLALFLLVVTYLSSRKLRCNTQGLIVINMSTSLAALLVFVLIGGHVTSLPILCGCVAALIHYFLLVFFTWTAVEAIWLYLKLVKIIANPRYENYYILKAGVPAWLLPLLVVIASAGPGYGYYTNGYYCNATQWPLWLGFLLPFVLLYIFDWIMFCVILTSMCSRKLKIDQNIKQENERGIHVSTGNLIIALCLSITYGLGWGFSLLATSSSLQAFTNIFQILFSVFVGLQGVLLLIFHGLINAEAQRVWKSVIRKLPCFTSSSRQTQRITQNEASSGTALKTLTDCSISNSNLAHVSGNPIYEEILPHSGTLEEDEYICMLQQNSAYEKGGYYLKPGESKNIQKNSNYEFDESFSDSYSYPPKIHMN